MIHKFTIDDHMINTICTEICDNHVTSCAHVYTVHCIYMYMHTFIAKQNCIGVVSVFSALGVGV